MSDKASCEHIPDIVELLLKSYADLGGINHIEGVNLPDRGAVQTITDDLLRLVFPGFYETVGVHAAALRYHVGASVSSLAERLQTEIRRSLSISPEASEAAGDPDRLICEFLKAIPGIREKVQLDVHAAYEGDPAATSREEVILSYPGLEAITVQRLAHFLYQRGVPIMPRMMTEIAHARTGIDIHPGASIGDFFFIDHGTGVVIGETTTIGNRVKLYQGVTLGAKSFKKDEQGRIVKGGKRHPSLEDDVTVYAGATILGGDTVIGQGSVIGGNVWLIESVAPYTLVSYENGETRLKSMRQPGQVRGAK
jgi:serine O-acetyltransferase